MKRYMRFLPIILAALALAASGSNMVLRNASAQKGATAPGKQKPGGAATLSVEAQQQILALIKEKQSRTPAQRKISSQLLGAMRAERGQSMTQDSVAPMLQSAMSIAKTAMATSQNGVDGLTEVNIKATVSKKLLMIVEKSGGKVINADAGTIRALMPLGALEELASLDEVKSVRSALLDKMTHRQVTVPDVLNGRATPLGINGVRPNFNQRAMNVRAQLTAALPVARAGAKAHDPLSNLGLDQLKGLQEQNPTAETQDATTNQGSVTSKGDVAHNVAAARNFFGVSGTGVKIGVLSDSV